MLDDDARARLRRIRIEVEAVLTADEVEQAAGLTLEDSYSHRLCRCPDGYSRCPLHGPGGPHHGRDEDERDRTPIEELNLPSMPRNALKRSGLWYVEDLDAVSDKRLLAIPNFGETSLRVVRDAVARMRDA